MEKISAGAFIAWQLGGIETVHVLRQNQIETEHVFLGMLKLLDTPLDELTSKMGMSPDTAAAGLEEAARTRTIFDSLKIEVSRLRWDFRSHLEVGRAAGQESVLHRSERCRKMFESAGRLAQKYGSDVTALDHLLLAMLNEEGSRIAGFLSSQQQDVSGLRAALEASLEKTATRPAAVEQPQRPGPGSDAQPQSLVSKIGRDLTELARAGRLGRVVGRDEEVKSIAQTLARKKKNSAILIGDPGVGKTAVVEALAQKLLRAELTGDELRGLRIVELRMGDIMAGTKFRGDLEERLMALLKEAAQDRKLVIFLDEIHTIMQAGGGAGAVGVADILKPAIQSGEFRCIGATTFGEYKKYIESDPALQRRFQPILIKEPSRDEALAILQGMKDSYEKHHGLSISEEALAAAVDMSIRYLPDMFLPDKALDLLDEAASMLRIHSVGSGKQYASELTVSHIAEALSKRKGIPLRVLLRSEDDRLRGLQEHLEKRIIGQPEAVSQVAAAIIEAKALGGLKNKPSGAFLFAGASGTGKTETAKALADLLFEGTEGQLLAFDMSEYMEEHSVAKLIGAPPGYIGYDAGGQLVEQVRRHPYSVVLFDEVEKAHPKVFDVFLQILDEARLTDSAGRRADFQNAYIILTSNVGSQVTVEKMGQPIGIRLTDSGEKEPDAQASFEKEAYRAKIFGALQARFRPEFLGRLPHKAVFYPLGAGDLKKILRAILIPRIEQRFAGRKVSLAISEAAVQYLVDRCDPAYGVRNLAQLLDDQVTRPLTEGFIDRRLVDGSRVEITVRDDRIVLESV